MLSFEVNYLLLNALDVLLVLAFYGEAAVDEQVEHLVVIEDEIDSGDLGIVAVVGSADT